MKLTVLGAAQEVTGSCHLIENGGHRILLDCGMIQGGNDSRARNAAPFPFDPKSIDAVILSHAHIDHSGRLPLLVKRGFRGKIYATRATRDLCKVMLKDSAFILDNGTGSENRKRARKHLKPIEPLYDQDDVTQALQHFRGEDFDTPFRPVKAIKATFHPAGHIIGASVVELESSDGSRLIFSGDIGTANAPLLAAPWRPAACDLLLVESTYGDRLHRSLSDTWDEFGEIIKSANADKGNILIPAFAVGRTQQILHAFRQHFDAWDLSRWTIFLDSPLAITASEIHERHRDLLRPEVASLPGFMDLPNVHVSKTPNQSMAINKVKSGAIIIAGSGMCEGGRIKHHLKHNLWRTNCHVVIVGFQAGGTLGRRLVDGAKRVSMWGEAITVGAKVHTIGGLSAHADQKDLTDWIGAAPHNPRILLVHGEETAQSGLMSALDEKGIGRTEIATHGTTYSV